MCECECEELELDNLSVKNPRRFEFGYWSESGVVTLLGVLESWSRGWDGVGVGRGVAFEEVRLSSWS